MNRRNFLQSLGISLTGIGLSKNIAFSAVLSKDKNSLDCVIDKKDIKIFIEPETECFGRLINFTWTNPETNDVYTGCPSYINDVNDKREIEHLLKCFIDSIEHQLKSETKNHKS